MYQILVYIFASCAKSVQSNPRLRYVILLGITAVNSVMHICFRKCLLVRITEVHPLK